MKVVAITGSRDFPWRRSSEIAFALDGAQLLIVGDARGADSVARKLAERSFIPTLVAKANWPRDGKPAGPIRNAVLVSHAKVYRDAGHEVICYAFPIGESPGTRGCMELMTAAGIPVVKREGE